LTDVVGFEGVALIGADRDPPLAVVGKGGDALLQISGIARLEYDVELGEADV
jgi:hypothetical protein